jgi:hypothetical protein
MTPAVFAPAGSVAVPIDVPIDVLPHRLRSSSILVFPGPIGLSLFLSGPSLIGPASRLLLGAGTTGSVRRHGERVTSLTHVPCDRQYRHELDKRALAQLP